MTRKVSTCLWFDGNAEEATNFYVSLIPGSHIETVFRPDQAGPALMVVFALGGTPFQALNGGPKFKHSEAASISVSTREQIAGLEAAYHDKMTGSNQVARS